VRFLKNAGWSSLVARQAHNLKVAGSNPAPATSSSRFSMAWVYVIQNAEGRFYIGMTTDLEERLSDHNNGVSKWTQHRGH
jgi:hypothetical protein